MSKKIFFMALAALFVFAALASLSSAYYYGGYYGQGGRPYDDTYDKYVTYSERTRGDGWGPVYTETKDYMRLRENYWDDGAYVTRTTTVKTQREIPHYDGYRYGYNSGYFANDRSYYGYPSRYGDGMYRTNYCYGCYRY